jgi:hypothetical protein
MIAETIYRAQVLSQLSVSDIILGSTLLVTYRAPEPDCLERVGDIGAVLGVRNLGGQWRSSSLSEP